MNLILIGYRGCGKSGVGEVLAHRLGYRYVDCDALVVARLKMSISAYVAINGWPAFREAELLILCELLEKENQVIATGGGIILSVEARVLLKQQSFVAWLTASYENIVNRIKGDESSRSMRPPLGNYTSLADEVQATLAEREPLYRECAGLRVNTDWYTQVQAADEIMRNWHLVPAQF